MALYIQRDLSNALHLEGWMSELMLMMHSIATMDLVTHYCLTGKYVTAVAHYITSLFKKVILLRNALGLVLTSS